MAIVEYFEMFPFMFLVAMLLLGLIVGSFLNVIIYRLPIMMETDWKQQCRLLLELEPESKKPEKTFNLVHPRSRCPNCHHQISAIENIPVISYLFLGGKCSHCGQKISIRYPLIELLSGLAAFFIAWKYGPTIQTLFICLLTWALISLTMIDFDKQLLPDDITLPFLWLGLLCNLFDMFTSLQASVIGASLGYGILWSIFILFKLLTGKEGMGHGDFKLLAMLGAWMGWQSLPLIILLASLSGSIIGILIIIFRGHERTIPIPFGPYLAISGWISLIWGEEIIRFYLGYF
ncbi:MAG: prepilin peptidase [Gammaproteobacteria bacterium]|nr:prepilin peptidase [Gammaproteobacteria bacterium]NIN62868.1 prepilin peptidase [Gammaproteobacteria bacterium]NIO63849.1 prepilin peptidase [Gammaproteobacteria bacterium]NIP50227.1 prepilin peptidase [Gammaproteobacteria bacterium]NIQ12445.1 prepilin peptidase [Gammaproteobacteria bacterium]